MSQDSDFFNQPPSPLGAYVHTKRVGPLLFISGVDPRQHGQPEVPGVVRDEAGNVVSYDLEAQCHAVFHNVKLLLEEEGLQWTHIVDVTTFLTHLEADFATYNRIYARYFAEHPPCRTTVGVSSLPAAGAVIELKVIAVIE
jgi:2-aminomuconate deaminase